MEKTFFMIKPDGVKRHLIGEIITRLEKKGLTLVAMKMMHITRELARQHYAEHVDKSFYEFLENFITSGPVIVMVWSGEHAIQTVRQIMGKTNPLEAATGTIRGDYALVMNENVVHGSDSPVSAEREIGLFFKEDEIILDA